MPEDKGEFVVVRPHATTAYLVAAALLLAAHVVDNPLYSALEGGLWGVRGAAAALLRGEPPPSDVVVVAVDEASLREVPSRWPWNRRFMAKTLDVLTEAGAGSVGLFFFYGSPSSEDVEQDQALEDALRRNGKTTLASYVDFDQPGGRLVLPQARFAKVAAGVGYPMFPEDRLGQATSMRAYGFAQDATQLGFPLAALRTHLDVKSFNLMTTASSVELRPAVGQAFTPLQLPLTSDGSLLVDYRWLPALTVIPFHELHKGTVDPARLRGKLVLVGGTARIIHDDHATPLGKPLGGVQIAGCVLASALRNEVPSPAPLWLVLPLVLVVGLALAWLGTFASPGPVAGAAAGALALWWAWALAMYGAAGYVLPLARPSGLILLLAVAGMVRWRRRSFMAVSEVADVAVEASAQRALALGMKLMNEGRIDESLKYFQKVSNLKNTKKLEGQYYMAVVLLKKGDMQVAANLISSIDVRSLPADKAYTLAEELERQGQLKTAQEVYEKLYVSSSTYKDVSSKLDALRQRLSQVDQSDVAGLISQRILDRRFKEVKLLGHGGMGFVYRAIDAAAGDRAVAIKVMSPFYANEEKVRERFLREARGIANFDHPSLIRIFDVFEANLPYYTMEYLGGWRELSQVLKERTRFTLEGALRVIDQAADALHVAHEAGITHRDVKPQNLMVDDALHVKVIDFGIARFENKTELTRTGQALGTPLYMSPEQVKGLIVDCRSDEYSLAVVLYQLLVGQPPFEDMQHHVFKPVPPVPPELGVPEAVVAVVLKALTKDRDARYETMREFRAALLAAAPPPAPPKG